jgi:hypothetical protein
MVTGMADIVEDTGIVIVIAAMTIETGTGIVDTVTGIVVEGTTEIDVIGTTGGGIRIVKPGIGIRDHQLAHLVCFLIFSRFAHIMVRLIANFRGTLFKLIICLDFT